MRLGAKYCGVFLALSLMSLLPASVFGAEVLFKSDTLFRVFERDTTSKEGAAVLPGYEYLQIDAGRLSDYGLSFHAYGWGRADFANNDYFSDQTAGEILYGYLQYRDETSQFTTRLGRQYIFEGVAKEAIDGLRMSGELGDSFTLSIYGGQPVGLDSEQGRAGDSIYGGRLAHRLARYYEIGVSYKSIDNHYDIAEEMLGGDLALYLPGNLSLYGYSAYNQQTEDWAEHSYELRIPLGSLLVKPFYQSFSYEDYFGTGANAVNPFRALAQSNEELTAYGIDALWQVSDAWTLGGKVKLYDYQNLDKAEAFSLLATWQGKEATQYGAEVGRVTTDQATGNDYTLVRLYGYCEAMADRFWLDFVSGDLLLTYYDKAIYGVDSSLFVSLGGGKRFLNDALSLKLSGDYSQDPYFDDDLRGMLTMSYTYDNQ